MKSRAAVLRRRQIPAARMVLLVVTNAAVAPLLLPSLPDLVIITRKILNRLPIIIVMTDVTQIRVASDRLKKNLRVVVGVVPGLERIRASRSRTRARRLTNAANLSPVKVDKESNVGLMLMLLP